MLLWVGERCHELRTLVRTECADADVGYPSLVTAHRWIPPLSSLPALPHLSTLSLCTPPFPSTPDTRAACLTPVLSYLVHSAPSLRYLHLSHLAWLRAHPDLLARLGQLTQLRRLWLGDRGGWMQHGALGRYWRTAYQRPRSEVRRGAWGEGEGVWGDDALPRAPAWRAKFTPRTRMRGGARPHDDVWEEWEQRTPTFRDHVDGLTGALGFFTALASSASAERAAAHHPAVTRKRARGA